MTATLSPRSVSVLPPRRTNISDFLCQASVRLDTGPAVLAYLQVALYMDQQQALGKDMGEWRVLGKDMGQ